MRGVDLERFRFDYDLTFAVLLMHPDGHVYHRYGGRDWRGADRWLGMKSFERVLRATLDEHAAYGARPDADRDPAPRREPRAIEDVPAFAKRDKGECIHCHSVFPALYEDGVARGTWDAKDVWIHPPPARIGIDLDAIEQELLVSVEPGSPAEAAGLAAGDRLARVGEQRVLTVSDLAWTLERHPSAGGPLRVAYRRGDEERETELALAPGWKAGTPLEFSWRPFKWGLVPAMGFGGPELTAERKVALGLAAGAFAFEVGYLVTWGDNRRFGEAAARAGVREGDVVVALGGQRDFRSVDHVHAWWRLTREPGDEVDVELLRGGERVVVRVPVVE